MSLVDFKIDHTYLQSLTMSFRIPVDDPKTAFLQEDATLQFEDVFYYITRMKKSRVKGVKFWDVTASAEWYRLGERKYIGNFQLTAVRPVDGLIAILDAATLDGLNWGMGGVTANLEFFSMDVTDVTYLDMIYQWAKICGCEVTFNTKDRVVHMAEDLGNNYGLSFRYNRNLEEISRDVQPPLVTRLFPYGRDNLSIVGIHGEEYLEDYSYYTNLGLTLEEARERYTKDYSYRDDSFVDENSLYQNAQVQFARLSQPVIEYQAKVVDLTRITGYTEGQFEPGDYVIVEDEPMDIAVLTRVARYVRFPYEPHRNEVELSASPLQLPDPNVQQSRTGPERWELFTVTNTDTLRYVSTYRTVLHRLPLLANAQAKWMMYYSLKAVCESTGVMTLSFTNDFDDTPIWPDIVFDCVAGQEIDYIYGFASEEVPSNTYRIVVRGETTDGGLFRIEPAQSCYWVWGLGLTRGQNPTYTNSIRFDYTGAVQSWRVPDDVTEFVFEAAGATGRPSSGVGGGFISGAFEAVSGDYFDVYVGGYGVTFSDGGVGPGWPNGGDDGHSGSAGSNGHGGGGSTHMIPQGGAFADAWFVAAGAGGSGRGGYGGFLQGGDGTFVAGGIGNAGGGATQTTPGSGANIQENGPIGPSNPTYEGDVDGQGFGGNGGPGGGLLGDGGHGGGGGWHGGGGGGGNGASAGNGRGGGGGGSGYVAPHIFDLEYLDNHNIDHGYIIISWPDPSFLDA